MLVISQTQQVQEEVGALLAKLRKAKPAGGRQQPLSPEQLPLKRRPAPGGDGGRGWFQPGGGGGWFRCDPMPVPPVVQGGAGHALGWTLALGVGLAATVRRRRRKGSSASKAVAASLLAVLLAAMAGSASAQTEAGNENGREAGPPIVVPEDAIVRPYEPQPDGGVYGADRLLVPYQRCVELWNRAHPDKKLETPAAPLPYALAGASYQTTLEGDEYLLLSGRVNIDVYADGYVTVPLGLRGGVLGRAELDGKAARLRLSGFTAANDETPAPPAVAPAGTASNPFDPVEAFKQPAAARLPNDALALLYVEGKGRHVLQVEVRVPLRRQGGWRVAEATLPAAPASTLAVKVPAGQTEVRLSQVPDRRNYDTDKDGQTIDTTLAAGGELALQWRPKVAEAQVDRGLTAQCAAVVDVEEDGLRAVWDMTLEFRRNQREQFQFSVPKDFLIEKVTGGNVRGWEVRKAATGGKEQSVEVTLLKAAKDNEQIALHLWRGGAVGQNELAEFDLPLVQPTGAVQASGS